MGDLREDQLALTRDRILDAAVAIITRDIAELSIKQIVRESGVSRPTVYRHFANKRAILDAVGERYRERMGITETEKAETLDELLEVGIHVWRRVDDNRQLRAAMWALDQEQHPSGTQTKRLARMRAVVDRSAPHLDDDDRARAAVVLTIMFSSGTHDAYRRIAGMGTDEALDHVAWAARRILHLDPEP